MGQIDFDAMENSVRDQMAADLLERNFRIQLEAEMSKKA